MGKYTETVTDLIRDGLSSTHFTTGFERALERAEQTGARNEVQRLVEMLRPYEKDSVVAKLLLELIERDL